MEIKCTSCGAQVPIEERAAFAQCPYCAAALVVDLGEGVPHLIVTPGLGEDGIGPALRKALGEREIAGDPEVGSAEMSFVPFWRFERRLGKAAMIAASTPVAEDLGRLEAPQIAGRFYSRERAGANRVVPSTVLMDAAREEAGSASLIGDEEECAGRALLHVPLWRVEYSLGGSRYQAWIEGVFGRAFSDEWPPSPQRRKDLVLGAVALLSVTAFFTEVVCLEPKWLLLAYPLTAAALYFSTRALLGRLSW